MARESRGARHAAWVALVDGNERLGWLATATFLEVNGTPVIHLSNDDVHALVMDVAANHHDVPYVAAALEALAAGNVEGV